MHIMDQYSSVHSRIAILGGGGAANLEGEIWYLRYNLSHLSRGNLRKLGGSLPPKSSEINTAV